MCLEKESAANPTIRVRNVPRYLNYPKKEANSLSLNSLSLLANYFFGSRGVDMSGSGQEREIRVKQTRTSLMRIEISKNH